MWSRMHCRIDRCMLRLEKLHDLYRRCLLAVRRQSCLSERLQLPQLDGLQVVDCDGRSQAKQMSKLEARGA